MKLLESVFCILFGYCTQEVKGASKCSIYDSECQRNFFQNVGRTYGPTGIKEIGIPVIDPFELKPTTVDVFGLWKLTYLGGQCEGISQCDVLTYKSDMKEKSKASDIVCNTIVVRGRYKLEPTLAVKKIDTFGLSAEGDIRITFNKWHFKVKYPIKIVRHDDKKIYVEGVFDKAEAKSYMDDVTAEVTGIKLGGQDISDYANRWINQNWKLMMVSNIGKRITDLGEAYYYELYNTFFTKTPASEYYSDNFENLVQDFLFTKVEL